MGERCREDGGERGREDGGERGREDGRQLEDEKRKKGKKRKRYVVRENRGQERTGPPRERMVCQEATRIPGQPPQQEHPDEGGD
jgi:hypothetical protein